MIRWRLFLLVHALLCIAAIVALLYLSGSLPRLAVGAAYVLGVFGPCLERRFKFRLEPNNQRRRDLIAAHAFSVISKLMFEHTTDTSEDAAAQLTPANLAKAVMITGLTRSLLHRMEHETPDPTLAKVIYRQRQKQEG